MRACVLVLGFLACATFAVQVEDGVSQLEEAAPAAADLSAVKAPRIRLTQEDEEKGKAVHSFEQLRRLISSEIEKPDRDARKAEEGDEPVESTAQVQQEEVAIGNTLKSMEAKEAVKEELAAETPVDCQMGEWSDFQRCSRQCGGGKKMRKRTVLRQSAHGGTKCGGLTQSKNCNMKSCAVEEEEAFEQSRKLTKEEQQAEHAQNQEEINEAMNSKDTETMWTRIQGVMKALVKTATVVIRPPDSDIDPEKYELEQILKKSMAKNAMANAMAKVNNAEEEAQKQPGA